MDFSNKFMGLGYGGATYRHDTGNSSSADAIMQQYFVNQQTGTDRHDGSAVIHSFVRPQYANRDAYMHQDNSQPTNQTTHSSLGARKSRWGPNSTQIRSHPAVARSSIEAPVPPVTDPQEPGGTPSVSYSTHSGAAKFSVEASVSSAPPLLPLPVTAPSPYTQQQSGGPSPVSYTTVTIPTTRKLHAPTSGAVPSSYQTVGAPIATQHAGAPPYPHVLIEGNGDTPIHITAPISAPYNPVQGQSYPGSVPSLYNTTADLPPLPIIVPPQPPCNTNVQNFPPLASPLPTYNQDAFDRTHKRSYFPPAPPPLPFPELLKPKTPIIEMNDLSRVAQMARRRAIGIINQLKIQSEDDTMYLEKTELGRKRRVCLDKLKEKHRIALLKNLEYAARAEDERLEEQLQRVQKAQEYHSQLEDYHTHLLEIRSKRIADNTNKNNNNVIQRSQAGIGTEDRQRAEKKRKRQTIANDSVSIYVSNLPKDGSASDGLMRTLFGSYGTLRKIHFYVDKGTGNLKGDALVIYNVEDASNKSTLTEAVCSQMNGAELPCGTSINVESSDPLHQLRKKKQTNYYGSASGIENDPKAKSLEPVERETLKGLKEDDTKISSSKDDDDLDDFFASLT